MALNDKSKIPGLAGPADAGSNPPDISGRMRLSQPRWLLRLIVLGAVGSSLLILKFASVPFFWLGIVWSTALLAAIPFVRGSWPRAFLWNTVIVLILGASAEAYVAFHEYTPPTYPTPLFVPDDLLGWAPIKSHQAHGIKANPRGLFHHPRGLLYDTTYTIDANGLRIAPPYREDQLAGTVLFFGCSFTFGDGLRDDETLPYQIGEQSAGRFRTFNFGFQGYSPAQMLTQLEQGIVDRVVDATPQYAFYLAIPTHVWRVAGRVSWNNRTSRYVLDLDGGVRQAGYWESRNPLAQRLGLNAHLEGQLRKSALWQVLSNYDAPVNDDDIKLYFAMVRRAQDLLVAQYPGIKFHVILYPAMLGEPSRPVYEKLRDGFRQRGIPLTTVEDILPGYKSDRSSYVLSPQDAHPSAMGNRLLAQYVLRNVLPQP